MAALAGLRVLLIGLDAVGAELAKNLVLSGVERIALADWPDSTVSSADLDASFFVCAADLGRPRLDAIMPRLAELDPSCELTAYLVAIAAIDTEAVNGFDVVVAANAPPASLARIAATCHEANPSFVAVDCRGLFARVFCDAGRTRNDADRTALEFDAAVEMPRFAGVVGVAAPQLHLGFRGLAVFQARHRGDLPRLHHDGDAQELVDICRRLMEGAPAEQPALGFEPLVRCLAMTAASAVAPMASVAGAIAAHEVMKTVGFSPGLDQWLYFEAADCLPVAVGEEHGGRASRPGPPRAFGDVLHERLERMRVMVVGAGAVGGEMLKNLALIGVGACAQGPEQSAGRLTVIDGDRVVRSNLGRQFLFRAADEGRGKAALALDALCERRAVWGRAHEALLSPATEHVFDDAFFEGHDVVIAAVDTSAARLYVDARCVTNRRPLLEAGTQGQMGSTQVVVPSASQSYGSTAAPSDDLIPYCELRDTPTRIEHCVASAQLELRDAVAAGVDIDDELRFLVDATHRRAQEHSICAPEPEAVAVMAGRLVPALVTTTSVVAGLACLELYKLAAPQEPRLERHRCWSLSLEGPTLVASRPAPAHRHFTEPGIQRHHPEGWTLWDRLTLDCRDGTLRERLASFQQVHGLRIVGIAVGRTVVYSALDDEDGGAGQSAKSLFETVVPNALLASRGRYVDVSLSVEDPDDPHADIDVPDAVRLLL